MSQENFGVEVLASTAEDEQVAEFNELISAGEVTEIIEVNEVSRLPTKTKPRRSTRQTKKKRSSSDSGEDQDDGANETSGHPAVPLSDTDKLINVGSAYQADIETNEEDPSNEPDRDQIIWSIPPDIDQDKLSGYLNEAVGRFRLPIDRALFILMKCGYDFENAKLEVANRPLIRDVWSTDESNLFYNAYMTYGKNFSRIKAAFPNRSMASIVQHYYETKKESSYKTRYEVNQNDDDDDSDDDEAIEDLIASTCEYCGERVLKLVENSATKRRECMTCATYMYLMNRPRPVNINKSVHELRRMTLTCPSNFKQNVERYDELTKLGTGDPVKRLKLNMSNYLQKRIDNPDDDDCVILKEGLDNPSPQYIVNNLNPNDDPIDSDTCRMTRDFNDSVALEQIKMMGNRYNKAIPIVWRQKQTIAMEDIEILNEESRQLMFETMSNFQNISHTKVKTFKDEMKIIRSRLERKGLDNDLIPGAVGKGSRVRQVHSWTEEERKNAIRCFHWYGDDFEAVAEVMGTKTKDQVKAFYGELGKKIVDSIESYRSEMKKKMEQSELKVEFIPPTKNELTRFNVMDYVKI